jgi:hypothetical protein
MDIYIGIDPGQQGGIAALTLQGEIRRLMRMPDTSQKLVAVFRELAEMGECRTLVEHLPEMPRRYVKKCPYCQAEHQQPRSVPAQSAKSMFAQGCGYGRLLACLEVADLEPETVRAQHWQQLFSLIQPKGQKHSVTEKKNKHKEAAGRLFPGIKLTHYVADALLIAEFARRTGDIPPF